MPQLLNITKKLVKIHNPLDFGKIENCLKSDDFPYKKIDAINLLAVGRLTYQKGFDLLIDAVALLDSRFYLTILGEGDQRMILEERVHEKKLTNRVFFEGFVENPYQYMAKADLFVLSSRYEGLPNVLLEVMFCGVPVVAFNCPGGIDEIIIPNVNGFIAPNGSINELAGYISLAAETNFDKEKIKDSVKQKFNYEDRVRDYERLFYKLVSI